MITGARAPAGVRSVTHDRDSGIRERSTVRLRTVVRMTQSPFGPVLADLVPDTARELSELSDAELDELYVDALGNYTDAVQFLGRVRGERQARGQLG